MSSLLDALLLEEPTPPKTPIPKEIFIAREVTWKGVRKGKEGKGSRKGSVLGSVLTIDNPDGKRTVPPLRPMKLAMP